MTSVNENMAESGFLVLPLFNIKKKKTKNYFLVSRNSQSAPTQWVMIRESLHALEDLKKSQKTEAKKKKEKAKLQEGGGS